MEREEKVRKLETLAGKINGSGDSLGGKLKKAVYLVPGVWVIGAFEGEFQEDFLKEIGIDRKYAKYLTIANATIFGLGGSALWHFGGQEGAEYLSKLAQFLGTTTETLTSIYVGFNSLQSIYRIGYVAEKQEPIISYSLLGILGSRLEKLRRSTKE